MTSEQESTLDWLRESYLHLINEAYAFQFPLEGGDTTEELRARIVHYSEELETSAAKLRRLFEVSA